MLRRSGSSVDVGGWLAAIMVRRLAVRSFICWLLVAISLTTVSAQADDRGRLRVAVLNFEVNDLTGTALPREGLGKFMATELEVALEQSQRFTLITRRALDQVMDEFVLGSVGLVDEARDRAFRLAGVDVIVTGEITILPADAVRVAVRFIDVQQEAGQLRFSDSVPAARIEGFPEIAGAIAGSAADRFPLRGRVEAVAADRVSVTIGSMDHPDLSGVTGTVYRLHGADGRNQLRPIGTFTFRDVYPGISYVDVVMDGVEIIEVGDVVSIETPVLSSTDGARVDVPEGQEAMAPAEVAATDAASATPGETPASAGAPLPPDSMATAILVLDVGVDGALVLFRGAAPVPAAGPHRLTAGVHVVQVTAPNHEPTTFVIRLSAGEEARRAVTLLPLLSARLRMRLEPPNATVNLGDGVFSDGDVIDLPAGDVVFEVSAEGFRTQRGSMSLRPGEKRELEVRLERLAGALLVVTEPGDAFVRIDDAASGVAVARVPGTGDQEIEMPAGRYLLTAELNGYYLLQVAVEVRPDTLVRETLRLVPRLRVSVSPERVDVNPGAHISIAAVVDGGRGSDDLRVSWDASCGTVNGSGLAITFVAPSTVGTCLVTVTTNADTAASAVAAVRVVTPRPAAMLIDVDTRLIAGTTVTLPLRGEVDVEIAWGDGTTTTAAVSGDAHHDYARDGAYLISIRGSLTQFGSGFGDYPHAEAITGVRAWGELGLTSLAGAFFGASNLTSVPDSIPATVTQTSTMFFGASGFDHPIGGWDTSRVSSMSLMFADARAFNQPIGGWNTSSVTDFSGTFSGAWSFDQPIGDWDTRNATTMAMMFADARAFDQPTGAWDTSKVRSMSMMFSLARAFDQPIGGWDTSSVTEMDGMFMSSASFNQDLSGWCVRDIADHPDGFDDGATSWTLPRPLWGMCPEHAFAPPQANTVPSGTDGLGLKIAVLGFEVIDLTNQLRDPDRVARAMSRELETQLVQSARFTVMASGAMEALLHELALGPTDVLGPHQAQTIGHIAGIDVLITGSVTVFSGDETAVVAMFIDAATGEPVDADTFEMTGEEGFSDAARHFLERALLRFPLQGSVLAIERDGVFISIGRMHGLSANGGTGVIYRPRDIAGRLITDRIGTFSIRQVYEDITEISVDMLDHVEIQVGDLVEVLPVGDAWTAPAGRE